MVAEFLLEASILATVGRGRPDEHRWPGLLVARWLGRNGELFQGPVVRSTTVGEEHHLYFGRPIVCFNSMHVSAALLKVPSGATRVYDLLGGGPDEARAAIAPFALDPRLWLFRSSMFYDTPAALAAALSDDALRALEDADGLFVAHTYLGPSARTTHAGDHLARLAVRDAGGGRLVLDPALDAAFARVAAHVRAGRRPRPR